VTSIAVDAMGGDHAPGVVVDGAVSAARHLGVRVTLVGPLSAVEASLARHPDWHDLGIALVEAPDIVEMSEAPVAALRRKPRASIKVAAELVAAGQAGALFSAGHTGATLLAAHKAAGNNSALTTSQL